MEIQVGLLIPRSHTYPMLSQYLMRGIKLAFAAKNVKAQFTIEDIGKGEKPEVVVGKANTLLMNDVEVCFAMVGKNSITQLSDVFSQSGVPLMFIDAGAAINLPEGFKPSPTTFIHSMAMWQSMYALGKYATEKYKKVISTSSFFESGFQLLSGFGRGVEEKGGEIVGFHSTQQFAEDDFKVNLKNLVSTEQPKALLCLYNGNEADEFYSKCVIKGYDGGLPILTSPLGLGTGEIETDNVTVASTWFAELETEENKQFVESYKAKYKKTPDAFAALAYEAAFAIAGAVEHNDGWDADEICAYLKNNKHKGIRGEFGYTETGETTDFATYIKTPGAEFVKVEVENHEKIKEEDKERFSSGWYNPYPCA